MIMNVNFEMFCDAFARMNRDDNFSYEGKRALFDYFEDIESDTSEQIELDVIAICCSYSEYSIDEALENYNVDSIDELRDNTLVLDVNENTVIVAE